MAELFLMFILGLLPVIWLVIALCGLKMEAYKASIGAAVVAIVLAIAVWKMPLVNAATAVAEGMAMAIWPIVIVIIAALEVADATDSEPLTAASALRAWCPFILIFVVLVLLIGWCFGGFLEGMAGFGTAVAIPASMLMALGFNPMTGILACLLANGVPTMFGSIGIPTTTLASISGLDPTSLAFCQSLQVAPFVVATPFLMVMLVGGGPKALKGVVPITLASGLAFAVPEIVAARFIGADLPVVVGAVCTLVVTFLFALKSKAASRSQTPPTPSPSPPPARFAPGAPSS